MSLEQIKEKLGNILNDPTYVYKHCKANGSQQAVIIIMKKLEDTITNESKKDVADPNFAKFRASKLEVYLIIDSNDPNIEYNEYVNLSFNLITNYKKGTVIHPNYFDNNLDEICSSGIHYFKTIDAAFYYGSTIPDNYSGAWYTFFDNGKISEKVNYINGKRNGKWYAWFSNGELFTEVDITDNGIV